MERTRENILSDISRAEDRLHKLQQEDKKIDEELLKYGTLDWDTRVRRAELGEAIRGWSIRELEDELKEYDRDPIAYKKNTKSKK